jgi:hypothetical protein
MMLTRRTFAFSMPALAFLASHAGPAEPPEQYVCPMHPEVRKPGPGKCPLCGMTLISKIIEPVEYPVEFTFTPPAIPAGQPLTIDIRAFDPVTAKQVQNYEIVHEKPMHFFILSSDLAYFAHEHPAMVPGGTFRLQTTLPKPGIYKMFADFYPLNGTPQLVPKIISTEGFRQSIDETFVHPPRDIAPKESTNLKVFLSLEPIDPIPAKKTLLFLDLDPAEGLEPYLGAWAHMLIESHDLIDTIHSHPSVADGGPKMQFDIFFPREAIYRIWIQFQRLGKVNTVAFTLPVKALQ